MNLSTRNIAIGALAAAVAGPALVAGGIAISAPGEGGKIDGCYDESNGLLSVLTEKKPNCDADTETPISWNVQGPQGPQGPPAELAHLRPGDIGTQRLSPSRRRRARLPLRPLKRSVFRRATPVTGTQLPVGNGGMRILKARVGAGYLGPDDRGGQAPLYGRGPDNATAAFVTQTYDGSLARLFTFGIAGNTGYGYVEVRFPILVDACVPLLTNGWIAEVRGRTVKVGVASDAFYTSPFNMIVVCDPRDTPPTTVGVAQPVPPQPTVVVP